MWFGTLNALNKYDGYSITTYFNKPQSPDGLSNNQIYSMEGDINGDLWIGTEYGLNRFDQAKEQFIVYLNKPDDPSSLSHNSVFSIYVDRFGVFCT